MKLLLICLCTLLSSTIQAQTKEINDPNATTRTIQGSFSGITVSDGIMVYLTEGTTESVVVSYSDGKYADRFKTQVEDGMLNIYFDNKGLNWNDNKNRKLKAYVSFKTLTKLIASGGADIVTSGPIRLKDLEMVFSSGTRFTGKITANNLDITQSSGSKIELSGTAERIKVSASSGAAFRGIDLKVDYCNAAASSGGSIRLAINKELEARSHSGGSIHYRGDVTIKDINVGSGGVVKKI